MVSDQSTNGTVRLGLLASPVLYFQWNRWNSFAVYGEHPGGAGTWQQRWGRLWPGRLHRDDGGISTGLLFCRQVWPELLTHQSFVTNYTLEFLLYVDYSLKNKQSLIWLTWYCSNAYVCTNTCPSHTVGILASLLWPFTMLFTWDWCYLYTLLDIMYGEWDYHCGRKNFW